MAVRPNKEMNKYPEVNITKADAPPVYSAPKIILMTEGANKTIKRKAGITIESIHFVTILYMFLISSYLPREKSSAITGIKITAKSPGIVCTSLAVGKAALYIPTSEDVQKYPSISVSVHSNTKPEKPARSKGHEKKKSSFPIGSDFVFVLRIGNTLFSRK